MYRACSLLSLRGARLFFTGVELSTDDRVIFVPSGTCGTAARDGNAIAQSSIVSVGASDDVALSAVDLPRGGVWKVHLLETPGATLSRYVPAVEFSEK